MNPVAERLGHVAKNIFRVEPVCQARARRNTELDTRYRQLVDMVEGMHRIGDDAEDMMPDYESLGAEVDRLGQLAKCGYVPRRVEFMLFGRRVVGFEAAQYAPEHNHRAI